MHKFPVRLQQDYVCIYTSVMSLWVTFEHEEELKLPMNTQAFV